MALLQVAAADPIAAAFAGWYVEVEDDIGGGDWRVIGVGTEDCVTTLTGEKGRWAIDWHTVRTIALEDVFVFMEGPGLKIAVVADVKDAAGQGRLRAMRDAMTAEASRCQASR